MKKYLPLILIVALAGLALFAYSKRGPNEADFKSKVPTVNPKTTSTGSLIGSSKRSPTEQSEVGRSEAPQSEPQSVVSYSDSIPFTMNLDVPFYPQAPDADWSMPWQEACEEAASVLAYYYVTNKSLSKEKFQEEVSGLVAWQNTNLGDYKHTNISQTAEMIKGYFGYQDYEILSDPTIGQMKDEISNGNVIIAPFAGRQLGNPFYTGQGPLYHMMVIKGYDEKNFITNDVGTKRGHNFIYPYNTIMSAMHEWDDEDISLGAKKVIVMM